MKALLGSALIYRALAALINVSLSFYVLYFYMGGLARRIVSSSPVRDLSDPFREGVIAYYSALSEAQVSLALSVLSLGILVIARRPTATDQPNK
jgi:hypothetical protein